MSDFKQCCDCIHSNYCHFTERYVEIMQVCEDFEENEDKLKKYLIGKIQDTKQ